jgi:hypothetical protein
MATLALCANDISNTVPVDGIIVVAVVVVVFVVVVACAVAAVVDTARVDATFDGGRDIIASTFVVVVVVVVVVFVVVVFVGVGVGAGVGVFVSAVTMIVVAVLVRVRRRDEIDVFVDERRAHAARHTRRNGVAVLLASECGGELR